MKKSLSILLALGMLFLSAPGCSGEKNLPENMERVTDEEMIAALNGYKAGMYGWQRYYTGMLTELTSASSVKLFRVEEGITDRYFCAYMQTEAFESVELPETFDRIFYYAEEESIDGKHIGLYEKENGDADETLVWYQTKTPEDAPQSITFEGESYTLDLVMAEKIFTYLYDCQPGLAMDTQLSAFIRYPCQAEGETLAPVQFSSPIGWFGSDGYRNDQRFRELTGEIVSVTTPEFPEKYAPVSDLLIDFCYYFAEEIDGQRYFYFPPFSEEDKEEFINFACEPDDPLRERCADAFLYYEGNSYLNLNVVFPPAGT